LPLQSDSLLGLKLRDFYFSMGLGRPMQKEKHCQVPSTVLSMTMRMGLGRPGGVEGAGQSKGKQL
jgi:hypothetical protein